MTINSNTKIGSILKARPDALEAIISLSPKFEKLRNPIIRKMMANRTSIAAASKIAGCEVNDFFEKLQPLGFEIDTTTLHVKLERRLPQFMHQMGNDHVIDIDVRPILSAGKDPLGLIIRTISELKQGQVLKIINSFYPEPLVMLLEKRGFESYVDNTRTDPVETYFRKKELVKTKKDPPIAGVSENWDEVMEKYTGKLQVLDVRELEMPLPMITILDALDNLPDGEALYVHHKRIPVFLLPELADRKFNYRIKKISEDDVHLIIFNE